MKKRNILKWVPFLLMLVSLYCHSQGKLIWAGIFFLIAGVLSAIEGSPYFVLFILIGLIPILLVLKKTVFLGIVALVGLVIVLFDVMQLIKLMIKKKYYMSNKTRSREFLMDLKENELTYKIWKRFRHKQ